MNWPAPIRNLVGLFGPVRPTGPHRAELTLTISPARPSDMPRGETTTVYDDAIGVSLFARVDAVAPIRSGECFFELTDPRGRTSRYTVPMAFKPGHVSGWGLGDLRAALRACPGVWAVRLMGPRATPSAILSPEALASLRLTVVSRQMLLDELTCDDFPLRFIYPDGDRHGGRIALDGVRAVVVAAQLRPQQYDARRYGLVDVEYRVTDRTSGRVLLTLNRSLTPQADGSLVGEPCVLTPGADGPRVSTLAVEVRCGGRGLRTIEFDVLPLQTALQRVRIDLLDVLLRDRDGRLLARRPRRGDYPLTASVVLGLTGPSVGRQLGFRTRLVIDTAGRTALSQESALMLTSGTAVVVTDALPIALTAVRRRRIGVHAFIELAPGDVLTRSQQAVIDPVVRLTNAEGTLRPDNARPADPVRVNAEAAAILNSIERD